MINSLSNIFKKLGKKTIIAILALIALGGPLLYLNLLNSKSTLASWYDTNWVYRKAISITAHTAAETNVYINLNSSNALDTSDTTRFQTDCGDLRFTDQSGALLKYYIVSGCGTTSTVIHVQLSSFPAGAQTIYYYYANPSVANGFQPSDFSTEATNYTIGSVGTEEQTPGPIAYWKFDDGTGTTAKDSTMQGNNGNLGVGVSAPTWQTEDQCLSGKCLQFTRTSSEYIDVGSKSVFNNLSSNFTISVWARLTNSNNLTQWETIFSKDNWNAGTGWALYRDPRAGINSFVFASNASGRITITDPFTDLNWHFVAVSISSGVATMYIDGVNRGSASAPITTNSENLFIGARHINSGGSSSRDYLNGYLDEVKIFPYARSAAQIQIDYNRFASALGANTQNNSALSQGLVGYWKMDETASPASDSSGNGNNGTWTGSAASGTGKFGNGGSFPGGTGSYISIANNSNFNFGSNNFTLSAWIKTNSTTTPQTILSHFNGSSPFAGWDFAMNVAAGACGSGKICVWDGNSWQGVTSGITASTWTHVMAVRNGTTVTFYVNGTSVGTITIQATVPTSTNTFRIGDSGDTVRSFNGLIDEARIYNRALSPAEVTTLYNFAPGPLRYYKFDDGSGSTVADSGSDGVNASAESTITWGTGKYNGAINTTLASVYTPDAADLDNLGAITVEAWVYRTVSIPWQRVVGKYFYSGVANGSWLMYFDDSDHIILDVNAGGTFGSRISTGTISLNTWTHLVGVYDGSTIKTYINGVLQPDLFGRTSAITGTIPDTAYCLTISYTATTGCTTSTQNRLNGSIDEVRIYNYARTQQQIIQDMTGGGSVIASGARQSPIGYWKFDEGYGTTANNAGSQGSTLNGTLTNMASPATSTSGWTNSGKFSKALNFDGIDDYVTVANTTANNITGSSITLEAWAYSTGTTGVAQTIISKENSTSPDGGYQLTILSGGTVRLQFYTTQNYTIDTTSTVTRNAWHHLVGVYDGSHAYVYVDGVQQPTGTQTASGNIATSASYSLRLGARDTVGPAITGFFQGTIDEPKIYNYALTADQVLLDMNRSSSQVLGALSDNSSYALNSANQEYCVPGDSTSCAAPVGRWDFETKTGTAAYDTSGNGYTLTLSGSTAPSWKTGKVGASLNYNGTTAYSTGGDILDFPTTSAFTLEAWVYPTTIDSTYRRIISKEITDGSGRQGYLIALQSGGLIVQRFLNGAADQVNYATGLPINTWSHVTMAYNGTTIILYVNGVNVGSVASSKSMVDHAGSFILGDVTATGSFFAGSIDQTRVFNYARSAAQVAWDYNRGGPVGWWKMDECQGTAIHDSSGNANTGTLTIGATGSQTSAGTCTDGLSTSAWWNGKTGKFNSSLNFDGTDDYVTTTDLDPWNDFSVAGWFKTSTGSKVMRIADKDGGAANDYWTIYLNTNGTVQSDLRNGSGSGTVIVTTKTYNDGVWHHFSYTRSGSNLYLYIDGLLVGNNTKTAFTFNNTVLFDIGYTQYSGAGNQYFNGQIDDVRVYNYALTAAQIKQVMNQGAAVRFGPNVGSP